MDLLIPREIPQQRISAKYTETVHHQRVLSSLKCLRSGTEKMMKKLQKHHRNCTNLVHQSYIQDTELLAAVARLIRSAHQVVDYLTDVEQRVPVTSWDVLKPTALAILQWQQEQ